MNLHLDRSTSHDRSEQKSLWRDNRVWWVNCLAIERYWFYDGFDLQVARERRNAMLASLIEAP